MRISDWSSDVCSSDLYPGLRYERTEGGYHVFQLPVQHPGHDAFQGCSGAPILDMERRVVGLVCSGSIPDNTISCVRSEERRVGKECVSTCRSRWSPYR